jgi:hypothetical protein
MEPKQFELDLEPPVEPKETTGKGDTDFENMSIEELGEAFSKAIKIPPGNRTREELIKALKNPQAFIAEERERNRREDAADRDETYRRW